MQLERQLEKSWPHIASARSRARAKRAQLTTVLEPLAAEDTSVVVFGSLARNEFTEKSDLDWTLLIDGQASPRHHDVALDIKDALDALEQKEPGREGTFGGLAISHDLLHRIGGGDDSNRNLTQRVLLLLESAAIGPDDAYRRVVREVLKRYILEDFGWLKESVTVPRFLLNDIARYWRTVAVDFAYKRRERRAEGWALRTVKLRMSRKLTYAAGLLACYSCAIEESTFQPGSHVGLAERESNRMHPVVAHLADLLNDSPLDIVARMLLPYRSLYGAADDFFGSYDAFLSILDNPMQRQELDELTPESASDNALFQTARELGHRFQDALNEIFLSERTGVPYFELTKRYGVF